MVTTTLSCSVSCSVSLFEALSAEDGKDIGRERTFLWHEGGDCLQVMRNGPDRDLAADPRSQWAKTSRKKCLALVNHSLQKNNLHLVRIFYPLNLKPK